MLRKQGLLVTDETEGTRNKQDKNKQNVVNCKLQD